MPYDHYDVVDCDGHIVEAVDEIAEFMDPATRQHALEPARNREGVFPSLDGFHLALHTGAAVRKRVTASDHRPGSADDWLAFLDKARLDRAVLFTSEGLSVGNIQNPRYAAAVCRAYNDYVHEAYARKSDRLRPMALIPMQDPDVAPVTNNAVNIASELTSKSIIAQYWVRVARSYSTITFFNSK